MIYECDPGPHVFWVAAENRRFIEADLAPDKVYLVEVRPTMGAMKAAVKLFPVKREDEKTLRKISRLLNKEPKLIVNSASKNEEEEELAFFIKNGLTKYNRDKRNGKEFPKLQSEMSHN